MSLVRRLFFTFLLLVGLLPFSAVSVEPASSEKEALPGEERRGVIVDLRNPHYTEGVLHTEEGGILSAPGIRIQAQEIIYTRNLDQDPPVHTIYGRGNLLIDYYEYALVGDALYYDFLTHTGFILNGKTASPPWYVGGSEILLLASGEITVYDGYLSTSEGAEKKVLLHAKELTFFPDKTVAAHNLTGWAKPLPLFWIPKLKLDLGNYESLPFSVRYGWGGFMGSYLSLLYRFLSWNEFQGIARLDGFFGHGPGIGIETYYDPPWRATEWYTRSYYAHDLSIENPLKRDRYRLQGLWSDCLYDVKVSGLYDYVSDATMAADFYIQDFDLPTAGRTQLDLRKQEPSWIGRLFSLVRVNDFQSVNQELPTLAFSVHPFALPQTGVIMENSLRASYLDYVFSDDVLHATDFHSTRLFVHPRAYRPFFLGPYLTVTPEVGFIGIAYSNSPSGGAVGQAVGEFHCRAQSALSGYGSWVKHTLVPYCDYHYLTTPRSAPDAHYLFTIQDGYNYFNVVRVGMENSLFVKTACGVERTLWCDLWANAFFDTWTLPRLIPKVYLDLEWRPHPRLRIAETGAWNLTHRLLDYTNVDLDWTLSPHAALGCGYRHRSRFDWRKADFYNFILEATRTEQELLLSPLSDRRDTFLVRAFFRLSPDWSLKIDLRNGWNRRFQPSYLEYQVTLGTLLYDQWQLQLIYDKRVDDQRYALSLKLHPGAP